jgi:adenine-specific DNA-methyltransferase
MGSKTKIIDFVVTGINEVHKNSTPILDLFAGSATLAGAIGNQVSFISNDIQEYSSILARAYLDRTENIPSAQDILDDAENIATSTIAKLELYIPKYNNIENIDNFNVIETLQQNFLYSKFNHRWHLFLKNYSGTWWSAEQCIWIDSLREVAEKYKNDNVYSKILAALMYAMAYCSQGTGHYAQYRDAKTQSSMNDILIYRKKSIKKFFEKKFIELSYYNNINIRDYSFNHTSDDYLTSLRKFSEGTVYADPPYCFVHYSRFYHLLETLVLYDYPSLQEKKGQVVKGRYRENRHQSPFCIKSKVEQAFDSLFKEVKANSSSLVLSYSNTGMISLEKLLLLAEKYWKNSEISLIEIDHQHMTLGRQGTRYRDVKECMLLVKTDI